MKKELLKNILTGVLVILFQLVTYWASDAQGVGIGTTNPQAKLHVAGTLRVDSLTSVVSTKKVLTIDSLGMVHTLAFDSLKKQIGGGLTIISQEVNPIASTNSTVPQIRVTLNLTSGTYMLFLCAEIVNTAYDAGARMTFYENSTEIGYAIAYSNISTFGSWSTFKIVSPTVATNYHLAYSSWPGGTTYIKRARMFAIKIL